MSDFFPATMSLLQGKSDFLQPTLPAEAALLQLAFYLTNGGDINMSVKKSKKRDLVRLGEGLRRIRQNSNLTQVDIASYCDIGVSTVYRIEAGLVCPTFDTLMQFAKITNTPIAKIVALATGENFPWFLEQYQVLTPEDKKIVDKTLRALIQSLEKQ